MTRYKIPKPTVIQVSPNETLVVFPYNPDASVGRTCNLPFDEVKDMLSDRPLTPPYRGDLPRKVKSNRERKAERTTERAGKRTSRQASERASHPTGKQAVERMPTRPSSRQPSGKATGKATGKSSRDVQRGPRKGSR
jgi:hypothetical protein